MFYPTTVTSILERMKNIEYDEGEIKAFEIPGKVWRFCNSSHTVQAKEVTIAELTSCEKTELAIVLEHFGNTLFL